MFLLRARLPLSLHCPSCGVRRQMLELLEQKLRLQRVLQVMGLPLYACMAGAHGGEVASCSLRSGRTTPRQRRRARNVHASCTLIIMISCRKSAAHLKHGGAEVAERKLKAWALQGTTLAKQRSTSAIGTACFATHACGA